MIVDTFLFQAVGDSSSNKESGGLGNPLGPVVPKSEVLIKRKTNPQIMNRVTNFVFEIYGVPPHPHLPTHPTTTRRTANTCLPKISRVRVSTKIANLSLQVIGSFAACAIILTCCASSSVIASLPVLRSSIVITRSDMAHFGRGIKGVPALAS